MIGVIIPDRGDRPDFLNQCLKMIGRQTRRPDKIFLANHTPESDEFDLTKRVRKGFERLKKKGCSAVLIMENDDWYSPNYIESMVEGWIESGAPTLFGTDRTIYYHLIKEQHSTIHHKDRSSLMSTLIACKGSINWPKDDEIFLDLHLWKNHEGETKEFRKPICLGVKHGVGKCGGSGHNRMQFRTADVDFKYLESIVGNDVIFYRSKQEGMLQDS